jgi:hypothetical protein
MKRQIIACLVLAGALFAGGAVRAGIIEDFPFSDDNGTVITAADNVANPGNNWLSQNTAINAGVLNGSFRIQKGGEATPVTGQVGNTLDIANITSGKAWLVAHLAGWSYTATASSPSERVRFGFLDNDPPTAGGSTITAEATIDRGGGALQLNGGALGVGSTNVAGSYNLPLVQSNPFKIALELDKTANTYTVHYKDGSNPWATLGSGIVGDDNSSAPASGTLRIGGSIRFAFTGSYNAAGEFVDVDRIYVTNMNPVPEATCLVLASLAAVGWLVGRRRPV